MKRGVFWLIDGKLSCYSFDGSITEGISKSGNTYNHKKLWEHLRLCGSKVGFDYYPRGRVEITAKGKTKFLTSQLNCARLSFAEADKMQEYLHTIPGSVSALELIFDTDNNIQLVIDNNLMKDEYICGHPGINTSTVRLLRDDMLKYVRAAKHEPTFIDLSVE